MIPSSPFFILTLKVLSDVFFSSEIIWRLFENLMGFSLLSRNLWPRPSVASEIKNIHYPHSLAQVPRIPINWVLLYKTQRASNCSLFLKMLKFICLIFLTLNQKLCFVEYWSTRQGWQLFFAGALNKTFALIIGKVRQRPKHIALLPKRHSRSKRWIKMETELAVRTKRRLNSLWFFVCLFYFGCSRRVGLSFIFSAMFWSNRS